MPTTRKYSIVVAVSLSAAFGCTPPPNITVTPLGAERTYPAILDSARIPLSSTRNPECPYDEIAAITAVGDQSDGEMLASLRTEARRLGADAIIGYTQGWRGQLRVRNGTAIRFRSADCTK